MEVPTPPPAWRPGAYCAALSGPTHLDGEPPLLLASYLVGAAHSWGSCEDASKLSWWTEGRLCCYLVGAAHSWGSCKDASKLSWWTEGRQALLLAAPRGYQGLCTHPAPPPFIHTHAPTSIHTHTHTHTHARTHTHAHTHTHTPTTTRTRRNVCVLQQLQRHKLVVGRGLGVVQDIAQLLQVRGAQKVRDVHHGLARQPHQALRLHLHAPRVRVLWPHYWWSVRVRDDGWCAATAAPP